MFTVQELELIYLIASKADVLNIAPQLQTIKSKAQEQAKSLAKTDESVEVHSEIESGESG